MITFVINPDFTINLTEALKIKYSAFVGDYIELNNVYDPLTDSIVNVRLIVVPDKGLLN